MTKLFRDYDSLMVDSVAHMADTYALSYDMDMDKWHNFDEIADMYGIQINDNGTFLNENKYYIVNGNETHTLIRFCEYKLVGDVSPCEIETDKIRYIILTNRKKDLLKKLNDDLYSKALQDKAFEVY